MSSSDKLQNAEKHSRADMPTLGQIISKHGKTGAPSTQQNYLTALRSLLKYLQRDDIRADELTPHLLTSYQRWLTLRGVCMNTVSCYMRSLRALYNKVESQDAMAVMPTNDLFKHVFTGKQKTVKRAITRSDISKLQHLMLPQKSYLALARDMFLFSFYAMGMPFVDIAHLRYSNLCNGYIVYNRRKTGQEVRVKIEPCMMKIIERYKHRRNSPTTKGQDDRVFPLLSSTYPSALHRYNRALRFLAQLTGINKPLTSYVVRHTWATAALKNNIDLNVIARALGHTNTNTTLIYIGEIENKTIEQADRKILDLVRDRKGIPKQAIKNPPLPKRWTKSYL